MYNGSFMLDIFRMNLYIRSLVTDGIYILTINGISRPDQMDQFISVLRVVGWHFSFIFKF